MVVLKQHDENSVAVAHGAMAFMQACVKERNRKMAGRMALRRMASVVGRAVQMLV